MQPLVLAAADFDPIQVVIIVLFVIGGFFKWLWENWQARRGADSPPPASPDPEEQRLREEAWRKQTAQPPRTPPPAPASDSWAELRKAWNELKEAAQRTQEPAAPPHRPPAQPPPLRQPPAPPARRGSVRETLTHAEDRLAATRAAPRDRSSVAQSAPAVVPVPVPAAVLVPVRPPVVEQRAPSPFLAALQNLRGNPALMRQAIVLHEVLGPPKALQSSSDAAI